ncbi:hypothetical protein ABEB36_001299 [Hypothenemus hampei]|uniref:Uncharacterized protein n=1 Tax=Hypothenemus hampei TaxID=57062 RepID=A0ABD1FE40_HYPHA
MKMPGTIMMNNNNCRLMGTGDSKMISTGNSREMRNRAEKQRRDRLNSFIAELAALVPIVSKSAKRLDKTSILRLSATHLRVYQLLAKTKIPYMQLPPNVDQFVLEQLVCDSMNGFLLIVTPSGKIVFISSTVENLLGYLQTDLMGQSLFTVTAPDDHDLLRYYLMPEGDTKQSWKKYFSIKIKRAGPKAETTPQYEIIKLVGMHRNLANEGEASTSHSSQTPSSSSSSVSLTNSDILIFFAKLEQPQPLKDRLMAVFEDRYVTRHRIDGRIIGCDQRISLIAGYMIEEVQGVSAFKFVHKDDVRYVMIALRQMYDKGETRANTCYRLLGCNGKFLFLRTFGFLEIDEQGIVESFVCINVQINDDEGLYYNKDMKRRYSALFSGSLSNLPYEHSVEDSNSDHDLEMASSLVAKEKDTTEDPKALETAIKELMQNLPTTCSDDENDTKSSLADQINNDCRPTNNSLKNLSNRAQSCSKQNISKVRIKLNSNGKRASSASPERVKRQRLSSLDSEPSQFSPPFH